MKDLQAKATEARELVNLAHETTVLLGKQCGGKVASQSETRILGDSYMRNG